MKVSRQNGSKDSLNAPDRVNVATEDLGAGPAVAAVTGTVTSDLTITVRTLAVDAEWSVAHPVARRGH